MYVFCFCLFLFVFLFFLWVIVLLWFFEGYSLFLFFCMNHMSFIIFIQYIKFYSSVHFSCLYINMAKSVFCNFYQYRFFGCKIFRYHTIILNYMTVLSTFLSHSSQCSMTWLWYVPSCVYIKEPLLLIGKNSPCSGSSGFPPSLSEWSFTICLTPYNCK